MIGKSIGPRAFLAALTIASSVGFGGSAFAAVPVVHPGDTLNVDVLNYNSVVDDSQGRLRALDAGSIIVAADGTISLPVAGTVHVAGLTTRQISALIATRLDAYVRDPSVTVRLIQQGQTVFLTGATTGTLPFLPGETLASALGQLRQELEKDDSSALTEYDKNGGTLTRSAIDLRSIVLDRNDHTGVPINGEELLRTGQPGPSLEPDDTLIFASKPIRVDVRGEVEAPGPIYLYRDDTLEQALLEAGGPLPTASTKDTSLIRDGQSEPLPLGGAGLRQPPQNGDAIVVRAAPHITVLGQVPTPGELTLKNGSTLLNALYSAGGPTKWANVKDIQVVHKGDPKTYDLTGLTHGNITQNPELTDGDVVFVPEGHKIDAGLFFNGLYSALNGAFDATHL